MMPDYLITSPEGKKFKVTAPEGATQEQVLSYAQEHFKAPQKAPEHYDPTQGMSLGEKFLSGAGKGFVDVGRGLEQVGANVGHAAGLVSDATQSRVQQEIDESKARDAPLMSTGAGRVGNIVGGVAATAPAALIPGANTYLGASAIGAGLGATQPVATGESRLANTLGGGASGLAGKVLGDVAAAGAGYVADKLGRARAQAPLTPATSALGKGYKLPPSMAKAKPSMIDEFLEGYGGKIKTEQQFSAVNQGNTNRLVRQALGLGEGDKVALDEVLQVRHDAGKAYDAVASFGKTLKADKAYTDALSKIDSSASQAARNYPSVFKNDQVKSLVKDLDVAEMHPESAVEIVKKLRADASLNISARDPQARSLGFAQKRAAQAVDDLIDSNLRADSLNAGDLYKQYVQARKLIAKTYDVEKALNSATGDISAPKLAKLSDKRPFSAELKDVADFAKAFPGAARDVAQRGSRMGPAISPLDVATAGISAAAGHGAPLAKRAAMAAVMSGRPLARKFLLSDFTQEGLRAGPQTLEQQVLPRAGMLAAPQTLRAYEESQ